MDSKFNSSKLTAYSGFFHDKEKLLQSASGGGATAISEEFIKHGGVVFGVTYSHDFKSAQFAYVETPEDLVVEETHKLCLWCGSLLHTENLSK